MHLITLKNSKLKWYFLLVGVGIHLAFFTAIFQVCNYIISSPLPLPVFAQKTQENMEKNYPSIAILTASILKPLMLLKEDVEYGYLIDPLKWQGVGANVGETKVIEKYNTIIQVSTSSGLISALVSAQAGQFIELLPGLYKINKSRVHIDGKGLESSPNIVFSKTLGDAVIELQGEGIVVDKPYWQFHNLHFKGSCKKHSSCEHAFHVVGEGGNVMFSNNIFQDFNAAIKVNGLKGVYPDQGRIIHNTFFNTTARQTKNPVTPIDLMHADRWQVSENFIFDFVKAKGNKISYGAFFKGGSNKGIFSSNLIMCNANLKSESVAIGLSLGGGGSPVKWHRNGHEYEHSGGVIRNNIIMNCPHDVGIYLNKAKNTIVHNNILYNTMGIDVRFKEGTAKLLHNVLSGKIEERNGGVILQNSDNIVLSRSWLRASEPLNELFKAPANGDFTWRKNYHYVDTDRTQEFSVDFCGNKTNKAYIGAFLSTRFCKDKMNLNNTELQYKFAIEHK
ncbi:hypothetical protein A9Q74_02855 [Colwellia sp. 39_35_sub15_T18]|nr:hypothetical protein A9Q74_02855 [Colwellia sp. 39_35_sub15_T18]